MTYTGATEVAGPGSVERVGKGVEAQACSTSALLKPAGNVATLVLLFGAGGKERLVHFSVGR